MLPIYIIVPQSQFPELLSLPDPGTPPPTPILHDVNSGDIREIQDIRDNGDVDTHIVTLRWTLSEPDDCFNTINFNVTPDSSTHCGSCEVGPRDPGMQEEFSCQVMQGICQSCNYRVYAVRCGDTQNGTMSEPVEVNLTGKVYNICSWVNSFYVLCCYNKW